MTKHIAQEYRVLDEIEHIRARPGMYAGSTSLQSGKEWVYDQATKKMIKKEISYIPAFVKIFSEILDNAIDESRRAPEVMDSIRVEISDDGILSVQDNGRGIPVEIHPQTKTYVATTVFSNLRAGSNFNDEEDQQLIGVNGVGSTLTNVLSTSFKIESCDGKKLLKQEFFNGMRESTDPKIKPHDKNYTKITFRPDYEFFKLKGLDEDHKLRIIKKVVDAAATNTSIKFYVNGDRVMLKSFDDYVSLYSDEYVFDDTKDWKVAVSASDGFEQISFVNSVETYQGGMHVDYVTRQIVDGIRSHIEKKAKVAVSPGDIKSHLRVYISANINRPKFSSQTKENMVSTPSEWKTSWSCPDKFIQKLLKTSIIQSVLDWVEAKKLAEDMKALKSANKDLNKVDPRKVDKFTDASERHQRIKTVLFLSEGDCLHEDTKVRILSDDEFKDTEVKNVRPGDKVLTHTNSLKQVSNVSFSVKDSITIIYNGNSLVLSPDHRLMVYDITSNSFEWVAAKHISKVNHKLVQSTVIDAIHAPIEDLYEEDGKINITIRILGELEMWCATKTHKFFVFDVNTFKYDLVQVCDLKKDVHIFVFRDK